MILRHVWCAFLVLTVVARADLVDDTVAAYLPKRSIPGVSLAVFVDGRIVKAQGYGIREHGSPDPVTTETLFQAGSVSKPVAALGALRLVGAGRLSLDADVNDTLKSWRVPDSDQAAGEKVTLRRLLSHGAGLTVHGFPGYKAAKPLPTLLQVLDGVPPANTPAIRVDIRPGSRWRYSGGGFTVMQQLVIDAAGQSFPDYMREQVLAPLGMSASTYEQRLPAAGAQRTASGHAAKEPPRVVPGRWHVYPEVAAAGLWTTPSDLARFALAVQAAARKEEGAVLPPALVDEMLRKQSGNYGLGVALDGEGANRRFLHAGRDEGFDTALMAYVERGYGAVVMINANDNSDVVWRILEAVADQYGWKDYPRPRRAQAIEDREPNISALIVTLHRKLAEGLPIRDYVTPGVADNIEPQAGDLRREFAKYGAFKAVELLGAKPVKDGRNYQHRLVFENENLIVHSTFNADGRIRDLNAQPE